MKQIVKKIIESLLAWSAKRVLRLQKPFIIGVTGSAGKTSTKGAIGLVLKKTVAHRRVRVSEGNLNTELGLPLAILNLQKPENGLGWIAIIMQAIFLGLIALPIVKSEILVLEYGADHPGDIVRLTKIARPDIAVVTLVGNAHTETLGSIEGVQKEKGNLVRALPPQGLAVLNQNDDRVRTMSQLTQARSVLVDAVGIQLPQELAIAVAHQGFNISVAEARLALKDYQPPRGRLNLLSGIKNTWLIDDTYNANPLSATLALSELERLARLKKAKRKIAILGDMLELGSEEDRVHKGIALLAERVADIVILVGPRFRRTGQATWFVSPMQAAAYVLNLIGDGDIILIKGSQSMRMEKVTASLLRDPGQIAKLLVRQTPYWISKPYIAP